MNIDLQTLKLTTPEPGMLQITLHRPDKLNALNSDLLTELEQVLSEAKTNPDVKGLIITGEGKAFCAGADINRLAELNAVQGLSFAAHGQEVFRLLETLGKPSIAAINGHALGGGCELAMSATLRIAADTAKFGQPEVRLGVIPGYGGTQRLARLVGKGRAMDLCLTGRFIDAQMALSWGLITGVTQLEHLLPEAIKSLKTIQNMAPRAIQSVMQVIDSGYDLTLTDGLHLEAVHFALMCATRDKQEGVSAFLAKREPVFSGE
ncbi:MAG: enoyl-CoA hydratase [Legionellales bacterium]|nr:enoyl-CoA hydratase [Legionellales bacterium]